MDIHIGSMFREGAFIEMALTDGVKIHGLVCSFDDAMISLKDDTDNTLVISAEEIEKAVYLYIGFPTEQTMVQIPIMVKGNGVITSFNGKIGFVDNCYLIHPDSFLFEDVLKTESTDNPESLTSREVLYVIRKRKDNVLSKAFLMNVDTFDNILDKIADLAKRDLLLAKDFCDLLLQQFPDDNDLLDFRQSIACALEKEDGIDFYQPVLTEAQKEEANVEKRLVALGRIYEMERNSGYIVDVRSHLKLFFFRQQLMGELRKYDDEHLVGQPVLYSIVSSKNGMGYQARSVIMPMTYRKAYNLAEDMHYDNDFPLNACDILRIILQQFDDVDIENNLSDWSRNENLWQCITPPIYSGESESLKLGTQKEKVREVILERKNQHTRSELGGFAVPEIPKILFEGSSFDDNHVPDVQEDALDKCSIEEPLADESNHKATIIEESSNENAIMIDRTKLLSSEGVELMVEPNAKLTYHYREGSLYDIDNPEKIYRFTIDDIIDRDLSDEVFSKRNNSDNYVRERDVVCQLFEAGGRYARHICSPCSVGQMLQMAIEAYEAGLLQTTDDGDDLLEMERAEGFVNNILNSYPDNVSATQLSLAIREARGTDKGTCYKAPKGVHPTGSISTESCSGKASLSIADPLFKNGVIFNVSENVDRNYDQQRFGDELMYAVYEGTKERHYARFVHKARPEVELISMAQDWAADGEIEKAWGIVMNILDANPSSERALQLVMDYERRKDDSGHFLVSEDVRVGRLRPVRNDLLAEARQCRQKRNFEKALSLYAQELEATENESAPHIMERRTACIRESVNLYSDMYNADPMNDSLRTDYSQFGRRYISEEGGLAFRSRKRYENLRTIVRFYRDMNDTARLIDAINELIAFLITNRYTIDDYSNLIAKARAEKAWTYICVRTELDEVENLTRQAMSAEDNELAKICNAVLWLRSSDDVKEMRHDLMKSHTIRALNNCHCRQLVFENRDKEHSLVFVRFALLCKIIDLQQSIREADISLQEEHTSNLIRLLAQYVATLLYDHRQFQKEVEINQVLPGDCWLVLLLNKCISKRLAWPFWTEIRLVSMLSEEAAFTVCNVLYNLDRDFAINLLKDSNVEIKFSNREVRPHYYAKKFNEWRGDNILSQYVQFLCKSEHLQTDGILSDFADFFRNLIFSGWMSTDDYDLFFSMRQQLPLMITNFLNASHDSSRAISLTFRALQEALAEWTDFVHRQPTLFTATIIEPLLVRIEEIVEGHFNAFMFCQPEPSVKVLSTSLVNADGSLIIEVEVLNMEAKASPMRDCQLNVVDIGHGLILERPFTYSDANEVYGNESLIYIIRAALSAEQQEQDRGALTVEFSYKHDGRDINRAWELSFPIRKWVPGTQMLPNVYDVGSVAKDANQFFGREGDVAEIVSAIQTPSNLPHYFIYGQKRSGKTSLLYHVRMRLAELGSFICVDMDCLKFNVACEEDIYYEMLQCIRNTIDRKYNRRIKGDDARKPLPLFNVPPRQEVTFSVFCNILEDVNCYLQDSIGWENYKLVLFIDEFTSTYKWFKKNLISKAFFSRWKSLQSCSLFSAVLIGQDVLRYVVRDLVPNDWSGFTFKQLTYLRPEDARRLVTEPIIQASGKRDIFIGNAVNRILYYSDSSTYYTKWICHELIEYVNSNRLPSITEADVETCIRRSLCGMSPQLKVLFDPLEYSGQDPIESEFTADQTKEILEQVTRGELNNTVRGCSRKQIASDNVDVDKILSELVDRQVLVNDNDYFKIKVKLYLIWTLLRIK